MARIDDVVIPDGFNFELGDLIAVLRSGTDEIDCDSGVDEYGSALSGDQMEVGTTSEEQTCWADAWDEATASYQDCSEAPTSDLGLCAQHQAQLRKL